MEEDFDVQDIEGAWDYVGSEVGKGWKQLYKPIVDEIRQANEARNPKDRIRILQIKKREVTLSIYVDGASEDLEARIYQAEKRSKTTCEICGAYGEERIRNSDYFVCCEKCCSLPSEVLS